MKNDKDIIYTKYRERDTHVSEHVRKRWRGMGLHDHQTGLRRLGERDTVELTTGRQVRIQACDEGVLSLLVMEHTHLDPFLLLLGWGYDVIQYHWKEDEEKRERRGERDLYIIWEYEEEEEEYKKMIWTYHLKKKGRLKDTNRTRSPREVVPKGCFP